MLSTTGHENSMESLPDAFVALSIVYSETWDIITGWVWVPTDPV